ncbi:hypothetical protein ACWCWD_06580 [Streptomyces sp. NPDC001493]
MTDMVAAVRIDPDGTQTDVALPAHAPGDVLAELLGGWPEYAHYGTPSSAVCVVVHETSMLDGHADNPVVTQLVERVIGGPLSYTLCGTAVVLGYLPGSDELVDLTAKHRLLLDEAATR